MPVIYCDNKSGIQLSKNPICSWGKNIFIDLDNVVV